MEPYDCDTTNSPFFSVITSVKSLWSPETPEHQADYRELGRFATRAEAEAFLASD
jgi:hypothetical protein